MERLMTYTIYDDVAQGSSQWWALKKGIFTASASGGCGPFLIKKGVTAERARQKQICKKLKELQFGNEPKAEDFSFADNAAIEWGNKYEPVARDLYTEVTGRPVEQVGFVMSKHGGFGCSPDGLIDERRGGLEIKCPQAETQLKYLLNDTLPPEYEAQVHCSMAVMGVDYWDFFTMYPELPYFLIRVERSALTDDYLVGLISIANELHEAKDKINEIYEEQEE